METTKANKFRLELEKLDGEELAQLLKDSQSPEPVRTFNNSFTDTTGKLASELDEDAGSAYDAFIEFLAETLEREVV